MEAAPGRSDSSISGRWVRGAGPAGSGRKGRGRGFPRPRVKAAAVPGSRTFYSACSRFCRGTAGKALTGPSFSSGGKGRAFAASGLCGCPVGRETSSMKSQLLRLLPTPADGPPRRRAGSSLALRVAGRRSPPPPTPCTGSPSLCGRGPGAWPAPAAAPGRPCPAGPLPHGRNPKSPLAAERSPDLRFEPGEAPLFGPRRSVRLALPAHSATTLGFGAKNPEVAVAFPSEGHADVATTRPGHPL